MPSLVLLQVSSTLHLSNNRVCFSLLLFLAFKYDAEKDAKEKKERKEKQLKRVEDARKKAAEPKGI